MAVRVGLAKSSSTPLRIGVLCDLCSGDRWEYLFLSHGHPVHRCAECGFTQMDSPDSRALVNAFYAEHGGYDPFLDNLYADESRTELDAATHYCGSLEASLPSGGRLVALVPPGHPLIGVTRGRGFDVTAIYDLEDLAQHAEDAPYDAAAVLFQIEKTRSPLALLQRVHAVLRDGASLLLVTPSLDSLSARLLRTEWTEWRPENVSYFDTQTAQACLLRAGFRELEWRRDRRRYSLQHLHARSRHFPPSAVTAAVKLAYTLVPAPLRRSLWIRVPASAIVITARRAPRRERPLLSIVMPVYNERATVETTLQEVLAKQVEGVDREILIVESNSSDGTRELVQRYRDEPGVRLLLQDRPRGKGNAVRQGLRESLGDFVIIQDADQEYDVNDYDSLIAPLRTYRCAFVLGSRHVGDWKIRKFNDQPLIASLFNLGHYIFLALFNLMYGQQLKDPFTMYKVFRRDCLHGVALECNRFDFDFELVIKLLKKGYQPLEIPVNYRARSFSEGKKVSAVRDPLTWIRALIKYRLS